MAWTRLTARQAAYADWVLESHFEDQKPAIVQRNVITFVGDDGKQEFLEALRNEVGYDQANGVRTAGAALVTKLESL